MKGISNTPNSSCIDAITEDGNHILTVPSFNFCIPCLSLPNCEDPNTVTLPLLPNLLLANFAKWSTEAENKDPGLPTCPNFTSTAFAEIDKKNVVNVDMTLTTPNCPVADSLPKQVKEYILKVNGVSDVKLNLVWDPPWDKSKMSEAAKLELNLWVSK